MEVGTKKERLMNNFVTDAINLKSYNFALTFIYLKTKDLT